MHKNRHFWFFHFWRLSPTVAAYTILRKCRYPYKPNEKHAFNFLLTGAPQLHGQKWSQSRDIIAADPKFNQHWGYYEGEITSERQNYYHKPVLNLNWDWTMGENSDLSTVLLSFTRLISFSTGVSSTML